MLPLTLLKERFGDVQSVVNHYTELINITPGINSSKGLRLLYHHVEKHLRSLEALHQDVNQEVFISIITSKVPKDVLVQLEIQKGAKNKWTVGKLEIYSMIMYLQERRQNNMVILEFHPIDIRHHIHYECQQRL